MIRVADIFRVGIGPSSSHTVGSMKASAGFAASLAGHSFARVTCRLLGSLAWAGTGRATDNAVMLGLSGLLPETIEPSLIEEIVGAVRDTKWLRIAGRDVPFDPASDIVFDREGRPPSIPITEPREK